MATKNTKRRIPAARTAKHDKVDPAKPVDFEQVTAETEKRSKNFIQPAVLAKIREADGVPVSMIELAVHIQVPKASVQHAVKQLMKTVPQIEVVTRGHVWRWNHRITDLGRQEDKPSVSETITEQYWTDPTKQEETVKVYTYTGKAGDGTPIVRDYEDNLYRILPL